ncbi:conserved hypothetical protein, partial [Trichinella spiralis]
RQYMDRIIVSNIFANRLHALLNMSKRRHFGLFLETRCEPKTAATSRFGLLK